MLDRAYLERKARALTDPFLFGHQQTRQHEKKLVGRDGNRTPAVRVVVANEGHVFFGRASAFGYF